MSSRLILARIPNFLNWCSRQAEILRRLGRPLPPRAETRSLSKETKPGVYQERWPFIGQSDVARVCREICESVVELERAFGAGELASTLTPERFEKVLGPNLYSAYAKLASTTPGALQRLRDEAVRNLLAEFENDLSPKQIAYTKVRKTSEGDAWAPEPGHFTVADASFDGISITTLCIDQMLDARFWGIGFSFETPDHGGFFARRAVLTSTSQLASDLRDLQKILVNMRSKTLEEDRKIVPDPMALGQRFEHLILNILNEEVHHARIARLEEDFLEKTDLRVNYADLGRRRGARVQITSIIEPERHESKVQAIRLVDELVFLSPLSLAKFVKSLQRQSISATGTQSFRLSPLWECLGRKSMKVPRLASELKQILLGALTEVPDSPLGPLVHVPLPVRQLIRHFVERRAFESTSMLRTREKLHGRQLAPSRRPRRKARVL